MTDLGVAEAVGHVVERLAADRRPRHRAVGQRLGDLDRPGDQVSLDLLLEAERLHYRHVIPDVRPVAALKARMWVALGRLTDALGWARDRSLSVVDDLSYLREFEHITLARVLIARYKNDQGGNAIREAAGLLERLLNGAEKGGRMGSVIEILVLHALAYQAQGNISLALASLDRALALAEPEGYVRRRGDVREWR